MADDDTEQQIALALRDIGFSKQGPVKFSLASYIQSLIGNVPKGHPFSDLQRMGMLDDGDLILLFKNLSKDGQELEMNGLEVTPTLYKRFGRDGIPDANSSEERRDFLEERRRDMEQLQLHKEELQEERKQLQHEREQFQHERGQLRHEREQLQRERERLQHEREQLQHEREQLQIEKERLQHETELLKHERQDCIEWIFYMMLSISIFLEVFSRFIKSEALNDLNLYRANWGIVNWNAFD